MRIDIKTVAMGASLAAALLMLAGKLGAYYITGSAAILSDAMESVIHLVATGVAGFSLWYAQQPASPRYPYGRGKVAYFSAGFEGALIFVAALAIFFAAVHELVLGPELTRLGAGLAITGALALVNLGLGLFLLHAGRTRNSVILVANGKHVLTDMWTSLGVVAGVAVVWLTGIVWLDPAVALLVGLNITWSGFSLMRRAFAGLLDQAPADQTERLMACLQRAVDGGILTGFHQLRHRVSNEDMWVEVHMLVPGGTPIREAHERVTEVEEAAHALFPGFRVHMTTHIEPTRHELAHPEGHPGTGDAFHRDAAEFPATPTGHEDALRLSGEPQPPAGPAEPGRQNASPPTSN